MAKYVKPCSITLPKNEDLKKLCFKGLITQQHHSFFTNLDVANQDCCLHLDCLNCSHSDCLISSFGLDYCLHSYNFVIFEPFS